jgi:hypothetical protein
LNGSKVLSQGVTRFFAGVEEKSGSVDDELTTTVGDEKRHARMSCCVMPLRSVSLHADIDVRAVIDVADKRKLRGSIPSARPEDRRAMSLEVRLLKPVQASGSLPIGVPSLNEHPVSSLTVGGKRRKGHVGDIGTIPVAARTIASIHRGAGDGLIGTEPAVIFSHEPNLRGSTDGHGLRYAAHAAPLAILDLLPQRAYAYR